MMIIYLLGLALSDTYVTQSWHCLCEWEEGSPRGLPEWHTDNNAEPTASSCSVRQTVTLSALGLFGNPC